MVGLCSTANTVPMRTGPTLSTSWWTWWSRSWTWWTWWTDLFEPVGPVEASGVVGQAERVLDAVADDAPLAAVQVAALDAQQSGVGPAQPLRPVVDGQRVGQLHVGADQHPPVGAVGLRALDLGRRAVPVAPEQQPVPEDNRSSVSGRRFFRGTADADPRDGWTATPRGLTRSVSTRTRRILVSRLATSTTSRDESVQ